MKVARRGFLKLLGAAPVTLPELPVAFGLSSGASMLPAWMAKSVASKTDIPPMSPEVQDLTSYNAHILREIATGLETNTLPAWKMAEIDTLAMRYATLIDVSIASLKSASPAAKVQMQFKITRQRIIDEIAMHARVYDEQNSWYRRVMERISPR